MGVRKTLALISTLLFTLACGEEAGGTTATTSGSGSTSGTGGSTGSAYPGCIESPPVSGYLCDEPLANFDVCCGRDSTSFPYACWLDPNPLDPSICTGGGFDPETEEPPCVVDCPEPAGGVCEGHGAWSREFVVWAVYERGTGGGATINPPGSTDPSACSDNALPLCMEYTDPAELQSEDVMGDMFAAAKAACDSMSIAEVKAVGFVDYPNAGSSGFFVTDHICTTGNQLFSSGPQQNNDYGFGTIDSTTASCGGDFEYDGYCMASDCPAPTGGTGTGGADSSSGGDSGTGGAGAFDCSAVDSSNVSLWQVPDSRSPIERHATIRGDLADQLAATPGSTLTECVGATMNSQGVIWDLPTDSILYTDFDMVEDDTITEVCVDKDCVAPSNTLGLLELLTPVFQYNGEFTMGVKRGSKVTIEYYVDVI